MDNSVYISTLQGKRIRECMKERNIKSKALAAALNYSTQHISYVLNGKRKLSVELAIAIANYLNQFSETITEFIEIHYDELTPEEKQDFIEQEDDGLHSFMRLYEISNDINYKYLLCESDYKTIPQMLDHPKEEEVDHVFKKGITAMLHSQGYDLKMNYCPDVTCFKHFNPNSALHKEIQKSFLSQTNTNELTRIADGKTLTLTPGEMYQLFQDFIKSICSITERKFEQQEWYESLTAPSIPDSPENNIDLVIPHKSI